MKYSNLTASQIAVFKMSLFQASWKYKSDNLRNPDAQNINKMKAMNMLLLLLFVAFSSTNAQQISYKVIEADADKYRGYALPDASIHIGGGTGLGLNLGARSQYRLDGFPLTLRGDIRYEVIGVGKTDYANTGIIEAGAMFPLIPGKKKTTRVKITTNYSYSSNGSYTSTSETFFYVDGQTRRDLLARGGIYRVWSRGGLRTNGLSGGLGYRVIEHAKVKVEGDYTYEANYNWQIYADAFYAMNTNWEDYGTESLPLGGRLGFQTTGMNWDWYGEASVYHDGPFYLIFGFLVNLDVLNF